MDFLEEGTQMKRMVRFRKFISLNLRNSQIYFVQDVYCYISNLIRVFRLQTYCSKDGVS
jgi:hypothetical protein